jgi:hypothetical protein
MQGMHVVAGFDLFFALATAPGKQGAGENERGHGGESDEVHGISGVVRLPGNMPIENG